MQYEPNYFGVNLGNALASGAGHIASGLERKYALQEQAKKEAELLQRQQEQQGYERNRQGFTDQLSAAGAGINYDPNNPKASHKDLLSVAELSRQKRQAEIDRLKFQSTTSGANTGGMRGGRKLTPEEEDAFAEGIYNGQISLLDQASAYQRAGITAAFQRLHPGEPMPALIGQASFQTKPNTRKAIATIESITEPNQQTGQPALLNEMQSAQENLGTVPSGKYGVFTKLANKANIALKGLTQAKSLTSFNQIKNGLAAEISSAFAAGGVPTDIRFEQELANLSPSLPPDAFKESVARIREMLEARKSAFAAQRPIGVGAMAQPLAQSTGWTPEKEQRLQELRAKAGR